jgi:hypothetical protein
MIKYRYNAHGLKTGNSVRFKKAAETVIKVNSAVTLASGLVVACDAGATSILGIAQAGAVADETEVDVILPVAGDLFECDFSGTTKTSIAQADVGTAFDLASGDPTTLNLDDTTGGQFVLVKTPHIAAGSGLFTIKPSLLVV